MENGETIEILEKCGTHAPALGLVGGKKRKEEETSGGKLSLVVWLN